MHKEKHNFIFYILYAVIGLGVVLELVGGLLLSPPIDIGLNTNISLLTYVGVAMIALGLVGYIVICVMAKKLTYNTILKDILMLVSIMAFIAAVIFLACVIVWPTIFPVNG